MPKAAGPEWLPLAGLSWDIRLPGGLGLGQQAPVTGEQALCTVLDRGVCLWRWWFRKGTENGAAAVEK